VPRHHWWSSAWIDLDHPITHGLHSNSSFLLTFGICISFSVNDIVDHMLTRICNYHRKWSCTKSLSMWNHKYIRNAYVKSYIYTRENKATIKLVTTTQLIYPFYTFIFSDYTVFSESWHNGMYNLETTQAILAYIACYLRTVTNQWPCIAQFSAFAVIMRIAD
jgi:hypothetical protein